MLIYQGQWESFVEVYENRLIILFEGSSGLDNPKQCLIIMTVYSSLVLYLMPAANTKSLCWVFFRAAQRLTHSLLSWVGLGVDRRQKCPSWIIETRCWPKGPGEWWRKNVPHQRKVFWTVIMWSLQGGNLELTLLFFPASTCGSVYYNSSIWRFLFFFFFFPSSPCSLRKDKDFVQVFI